MALCTFCPTFNGPAIAGAVQGALELAKGGSSMLTAILAGATLLSGMVILALAARAHTRSGCQRMGVMALAYSLWSAVILAIQVGPPSVTQAGSLTLPKAAIPFAVSLSLGLTIAVYSSIRRRGMTSTTRARGLKNDDIWQAIVRATTASASLDEMLFSVAAVLRHATSAQAAHVFKISHARRRALRIGTITEATASINRSPINRQEDRGHALSDLAWQAAVKSDLAVAPMTPTGDSSTLALPFGSDGVALAVMVLDNPRLQAQVSADRRMLLSIGALVGRALADWTGAAMGARYSRLCDNLRRLFPALATTDRFERGLTAIADGLRGVCDVDYLSVSWLDRSRFHENRVSMLLTDGRGPDESVLENRRRWPISDSQTQRVMAMRRALITPDLRMASVDGLLDGEPWECRLGMRSRLVAPILDGDEIRGTITVAHRRVAFYGESEIHVLAVIADVLSLWLRGLEGHRDANRLRAVETFVQRLRDDVDSWSDDAALLQDAKELLDVSGMRLFRYDSEERTLEQVAAAGRVGRSAQSGPMPLDCLPWHRWALGSHRLLQIDQGDPESLMTANEAESTLAAGIKTGCVVPITVGDQWLGALNVLEMRDPDRSRLDRMDRLLLSNLASVLASRWTRQRVMAPPGSSPSTDIDATRELHRRIVNPLTSIIGSAELIRHKQADLSLETMKYLKTIERCAASVHESVVSFMAELGEHSGFVPPRHGRNGDEDVTWCRAGDGSAGRTGLTRPASFLEANHGVSCPESMLAAGPGHGVDTARSRFATVVR
ncbi:MAG: GAF domain-containing protein [Candidatus Zixiibacteriota bacterium]